MKDLEGGLGAEKKCVTGKFLWCFGFFGGKNVKKSPYPLVRACPDVKSGGSQPSWPSAIGDEIQNFYELDSKDLCL